LSEVHFCAIQRQSPDLQQPGFTTQNQRVQKQRLQVLQMPKAKVGDAAKVRNVFAHDHPKSRIGGTAFHDFPQIKTKLRKVSGRAASY